MKRDKYGKNNIGRCQNILNQIKQYIVESEIYRDVESITLNVVGDDVPVEFVVPNSEIVYLSNHIHEWEFPTLDHIREYSKKIQTIMCYIFILKDQVTQATNLLRKGESICYISM